MLPLKAALSRILIDSYNGHKHQLTVSSYHHSHLLITFYITVINFHPFALLSSRKNYQNYGTFEATEAIQEASYKL